MSDEAGTKLGKARALRFTDNAVHVHVDDLRKAIWVPLAVIHDDSELYDSAHTQGELVVENWWAEKHGYA